MVERYASGSSLVRTNKEEALERLEGMLAAEFSDELFVALKKLTVAEIRKLHLHVAAKINDVHEQLKESKK